MANGNLLEHSYVTVATLAAVVLTAIAGGMGYGSLAKEVETNTDQLERHEDKPAHTDSIQDVAYIKAQVATNTATLIRLEKQAEKDKKEILEAIKELKD